MDSMQDKGRVLLSGPSYKSVQVYQPGKLTWHKRRLSATVTVKSTRSLCSEHVL